MVRRLAGMCVVWAVGTSFAAAPAKPDGGFVAARPDAGVGKSDGGTASAKPVTPTAVPPTASAVAQPPAGKPLEVTPVQLPGGPALVSMDYLAIDPATARVWVPAGNTGKVDVIDASKLTLTILDGFPTVTKPDNKVLGPSSATVGTGAIYVGNRADMKVCAIDAKTMMRGECASLKTMPDGVAYVSTTQEVWVTTPKNKSITLLDVSDPKAPKFKDEIKLEGAPEGYAVDPVSGRFYTNLEDKDVTLVFDVKTHQEVTRYPAGCGTEGPRGLAIDRERQILMVACTDKVSTLLLNEKGKVVAQLQTGEGVDGIDYVSSLHTLYVAAGKAGQLTIAELSNDGDLRKTNTAATAEGARVVVADPAGNAFVADSKQGRVLVVRPKPVPTPAKK